MHPWNLTPKQAVELQKQLREQIRTDIKITQPRCVAGVDVAYARARKESVASVVVLSYPGLKPVEEAVVKIKTPFPYVPGLLSFREIPAILKALDKLSVFPELIFVDGHGRAHPRRIGIASHLGLWLKHPTIGIGKSRLCGDYQQPEMERGASTDLVHKGEIVGKVLRTRTGVKPIFVSIGYGLKLEDCLHWTLATAPRFRLPEPIRQAHLLCAGSKSMKNNK